MEHIIGNETCERCTNDTGKIKPVIREFHALISSPKNKIVWYECGHVIIVRNGIVKQEYTF